jgi:hypothetical protein
MLGSIDEISGVFSTQHKAINAVKKITQKRKNLKKRNFFMEG